MIHHRLCKGIRITKMHFSLTARKNELISVDNTKSNNKRYKSPLIGRRSKGYLYIKVMTHHRQCKGMKVIKMHFSLSARKNENLELTEQKMQQKSMNLHQ